MKKKAPTRKPSLAKVRSRSKATAMVSRAEVEVRPAKGRPMLTWVGKRPLSRLPVFPAQHIETYDPAGELSKNPAEPDMWAEWPAAYPKGGLLFHGDNKEVLAHLLASGFRGKVTLIYIDPPFDSGADYVRKVALRGAVGGAKLDGETYALGEQIQYTDIWANDNYLQFMYERLLLLKELLAEEGSIWLHCDPGRSHYLKLVLDEVFGNEEFVNEIVWKRSAPKGLTGNQFPDTHDNILYYCRDRSHHRWRRTHATYTEEHIAKFRYVEEGSGRKFMMDNLQNPNPNRPNLTYEWNGHVRCWRWTKERMQAMHDAGMIAYAKNGMPYLKRYLDELEGPTVTDTWMDIAPINSQALEREGYPTQKPEELANRIIETASGVGDVVLDCFVGSGTAAAAAQKLGRRWVSCDINKGAIQTTAKRLQGIIGGQIVAQESIATKPKLPGIGEGDGPGDAPPAQFAFTVWRVNDYDLQIQHNEAVELTCEHIGVERMRSDPFFDGVLGKSLVKIIPFNHPLSPVDLDELRRELEARPDEDRAVTVVCLGAELAAQAWIEDWNRLRKGKNAVNRIAIIELRTDPRYGKFIRHEPASARVKVVRKKDQILVEIEDFMSPTIIERLEQQAGLLKPKIDDWRAMVDCVMIDTAYDGKVLNVVLSDIPEKKTDLVAGRYELPVPDGKTTVAVKVIDMLGEEVLVIKQV